MSPEQIVRLIDFRYITDCITPAEALEILEKQMVGKKERIADLEKNGYPWYTTSAGWLGYGDDKLRHLVQEAIDAGFKHIKLKVGRDRNSTLLNSSHVAISYADFCLKK